MKRSKFNLMAFIALAAITLSGCAGPDKMKQLPEGTSFKVTPNPLEVHANVVKGTIEGTFPAKYFNKKALLEITPVLVYEGGELTLPVKMLQGQDVEDNHQAISFDAGGSFKHEIEFEYKDAMLKSDLELRIVIVAGDNRIPFDQPQKVGVGVLATSKMVELKPKPSVLADNFQRVVSSSQEAQINFVIQRSDIRRSELTRDELKSLQDFVASTSKDEDLKLKGLSISAYASPDGPENLNEKLSNERGKNTEKWLADMLEKAKVGAKPSDIVTLSTTSEDWDGFQKLVAASDIQDKELILRVLSMYSDPAVRESEIKNLSKVYLVLAEKILPELRRSKMVAQIDRVGYSDEELKQMVEANNIDTLNIEEMLYAATLVSDKDAKLSVYKKAAELHNDVRAHNNAAYIYIKKGDAASAKASLEKAVALDANNHAVKNNLGCVAMLEGNIDNAQNLFVQATNAGQEVKYNLGIISIVKGQYPAAVEYLGGTDSFNQGLAMLLSNRNDAAKNTFQKVEEPMGFYGLAIVAARTGDENLLLNSLRTAVGKDASLKARAKKDLEFRNYFQNDAFKAIVE